MERLLNQALGTVRDLLLRNRAALDAIIHALTSQGAGTLSGEARVPRLSQSHVAKYFQAYIGGLQLEYVLQDCKGGESIGVLDSLHAIWCKPPTGLLKQQREWDGFQQEAITAEHRSILPDWCLGLCRRCVQS